MNPELSLVTGTVNRPESFKRLLHSIREHTSVSWQLVVSDASDIPYTERLPQVLSIVEKPRMGCIRGYNAAFKRAKGKWVIWLNDDCEVLPGYAEEAIAFMDKHTGIGLGCLHYKEGDLPFHINSAWGVPYANFGIINRELGNKVGWFDERLHMYGCDNSLTFRVLLADCGVADIPNARVIHHSVKDKTRADNQLTRLQDNRTLQEAYMPLRHIWQHNYRKYQLASSTVPWSHGQNPVTVSV